MSFYVIALTFINTHVRRNLAIKNPIDHLQLFCLGLLQLIFFNGSNSTEIGQELSS